MKIYKAIKGRIYTKNIYGYCDMYMSGYEKYFIKKGEALNFLENVIGKKKIIKDKIEYGFEENILEEIYVQ